MTREEFIKRFVEILKSKANLSEGTVAEISLLLELMPNTNVWPSIYYYPYRESYWRSSPYEDNKIYCTSDVSNDAINREFVKKPNEMTGGDELKGDALINALMENIFS